jgi:hypothetical protein
MTKIREKRKLRGGFKSLWEMPLITEKEICELDPKKWFSMERLCLRTKIWLHDWYPVLAIILGVLTGVYYFLEILKILRTWLSVL